MRKKIRLTIALLLLLSILSSNFLSAQVWQLAKGSEGFAAVDIDIYYSNPDTMYAIGGWINKDTASARGSGLLISTDRGESWNVVGNSPSTDVGAIKVDPYDSKRIYISVYGFDYESNDIWMTTDGGISWNRIFGGRGYPAPVVEIDPVDLRTVYVGVGPAFIYRSSDRGETWEQITTPPATSPSFLNALTIAPSNNRVLYAAYVSGLFKSIDKGTSWIKLPLDPGYWGISCVAVDPHNSNNVYATVFSRGLPPGGVFKSTDGGMTWEEKNNGLDNTNWQIQSILINSTETNELFIGTASIQNKILFHRFDSESVWALFNNGLPDSGGVGTIVLDGAHNRLVIAVGDWQETGIYTYDLVANTPSKPETFSLQQNYPNPFNSTTTICYTLPEDVFVRIELYDILGRKVRMLEDNFRAPGTYAVKLEGSDLPSGVYFYRLVAGPKAIVRKAVLIK
jgi:Secretion system C-terminal sorting domain